MASPTPNRLNPTFVLWPIQNARTAWQPVWMPVVLVVPKRRLPDGRGIANSDVRDVKFFIENAPGQSPIAGVKYQGILVPELERFVQEVSVIAPYYIDLKGEVFEDQTTGQEKTFDEAVEGDYVYLSLSANSVRDKVIYYPDANYYDFSTISISTIELQPLGVYNFVWQASYYERVETPEGELLCITENEKITRLALPYNHPGDVHRAMVSHTPEHYLEGDTFDQDSTVAFYRPFADVLQDIFDEQTFIRGINWVNNIPAQYIPYLGYLLGWDLPYFAGSTDDIRRAFIRNARKLQRLKGSRRAIVELFEIFGFTIDVVNLWFRTDGNAFIGPYDSAQEGFEDEYITIAEVCQAEPLISAYDDGGFGEVTIPLLYRAKGDITIESWLAGAGATQTDLDNIVTRSITNPDGLEQETCTTTIDGFLINDTLAGVDNSTSNGYSKVLVDREIGEGVDEITVGNQPVSQVGVTYNKDTNEITIVFDRYLDFANDKLYVFATYERDKITPSPKLTDLRSNRFDIRVLLYRDGEQPTTETYDYLINFLFKIKAFHSLLRKISFTLTYEDVYNVTDFCAGGLNTQEPDTSAGELQVPPAVLPNEISCETNSRGFKQSDLDLRSRVIDGLENEHQTWKDLDGTHEIPPALLPIVQSLSRIDIPTPQSSPCEWTYRGQNRVLEPNAPIDYDHNTDTRERLCNLTGNTQNYCYNGRVKDELIDEDVVKLSEYVRCRPCDLMAGSGVYWTQKNVNLPPRWLNINNISKSWNDAEFVRRAYWDDEIRFTTDMVFPTRDANAYLAIRKPSLQIEKTNLFFPGHRFITMNKLENDFISQTYNFRPWDDLLNIPCPEDMPNFVPDLDTTIETDTNGDEYIVFNDIQLFYYGNGLTPDISSLGDHSAGTEIDEDSITHKIFTSVSGGTDSAVEFDTLVETAEESIHTADPIFNSADRTCDCTDCTEGTAQDYIDGYPALTGAFQYLGGGSFTYADDVDSQVALAEWASYLGMPDAAATEAEPVSLLFQVSSGIRSDDSAYRLDCQCLYDSCGTGTEPTIPETYRCIVNKFVDSSGEIDWDCGQLEMVQRFILSEYIGACSILLDGTISSMLLVDSSKVQIDTSGPVPVVHYKFVDEWGVITVGSFKADADTLDISWTTMEPRVWGRESQGFIQDRKVFREGTITVSRQVLKVIDDTTYIQAEGYEQWVGFFQTNFSCGDEPLPLDPFIYHVDCGIVDEVEMIVTGTGTGTE